MDRRDFVAKYGTELSTLPNVEISFSAMRATFFLDSGEGGEPTVHSLSLKWKLCPTCGGCGCHVNPSIDSGGLSAEDFEDDPDFRELYFNGSYDVECYECAGRTTVLSIDEETSNPESLKVANDLFEDRLDFIRECESERRYGA